MTELCGSAVNAPFQPLIKPPTEARTLAQDKLPHTSAPLGFPHSQDANVAAKTQSEFDAFGSKAPALPSLDTFAFGVDGEKPALLTPEIKDTFGNDVAKERAMTSIQLEHAAQSELWRERLFQDKGNGGESLQAFIQKLSVKALQSFDFSMQSSWVKAVMSTAWKKATEKKEELEKSWEDATGKEKETTKSPEKIDDPYYDNARLTDEEYTNELNELNEDCNTFSNIDMRIGNLERNEHHGVMQFLDNITPEWKKLDKFDRKELLEYSLTRFKDFNGDKGNILRRWPEDPQLFAKTIQTMAKMQEPKELEILAEALCTLTRENIPEGIITSNLYQFFISVYEHEKATKLPPPGLLVKPQLYLIKSKLS